MSVLDVQSDKIIKRCCRLKSFLVLYY